MINVRLVFVADPTELWSTDSTWDGTVPLWGFSTTSHDVGCFLVINGEIFILSGSSLWVTDRTFSRTPCITEFNGSGLQMVPFGGRMVLGGLGTGSGGKDELWILDGTEP